MEQNPEGPDVMVGPGDEFTGETEVADVPEVVTGADVELEDEEATPEPEPEAEPKTKAKESDK